MQLDQRLDVLRSVATPPAVGRHAELVDEALGGDDAGGRPGEAVGRVDQAEVEVRLRTQGELRQGLEEADVDTSALNGQMDPVERSSEAERQGVGDVDERLGVVGALAVMSLVPVAEVVAEVDVGGDAAPEAHEPLDDARLGVVEPRRHHPVEHGELEVGVPLHGQLVVGESGEDRRQLVEDARLVERLDASLVLGGDEGGDRGQWSRQRDLEPAVRRDLPVALAAGEDFERRQRGLGVAEVVEAQRVDRLAVADPQPGQGAVRVRAGGQTSNSGRELSTGYCQTIQSDRGPVSPSGIWCRRSPSRAAIVWNTSSALRNGTLPTRSTPPDATPSP